MSKTCRLVLLASTLLILTGFPGYAQWVTQSIPLKVGWNAVFLEGEPYPVQCDLQFQGLPIGSVWTHDPRFSSVEFVQDPAELSPEIPDWRFYFPPHSPQAFATNLFILQAGKAYLINAEEATVWNVVQRPVLRKQTWIPDSYNLVGFPVDPASPPTFSAWFAGSSAHSPLTVWALGPGDVWERVTTPSATTIQAGKAYWVFSNGQSQHQGLVDVTLTEGLHLNYGQSLVEHTIEFSRNGIGQRDITVNVLASEPVPDPSLAALAGSVPLSYYDSTIQGESATFGYYDLPATVSFPAGEAAPLSLRLAVERDEMVPAAPEAVYQSVLEIKDGMGYRRLIGVESRGRTPQSVTTKLEIAQSPDPSAGLWVGNVTLSEVSEPQMGVDFLTETPAEFSFRVILHVDADGTVRLLNEVTQFWRAGTLQPDPENPGYQVVDEAGRYVLVTPLAPQSLLDEIGAALEPATLRDGRPFARRVSTAAYSLLDGEGNPEEPEMVTSGEFGLDSSTLQVSLLIEDSDPLNPFHHEYHPKHKFTEPPATPVPSNDWTINWNMTFTFSGESPDGLVLPGWGDSQVGGTYEEEVTGLKSGAIKARGIFRLQRAAAVPVLNDGLGI